MATNIFFHIIILLSIFAVCRSQYNPYTNKRCFYTMYIGTGSLPDAGTNSTISLEIWDETGYGIVIPDLIRDAGYGPNDQYDCFESGHIDMFKLAGFPLKAPLCAVKFTSDGKGSSWYANFIEITYACLGQPVQQRTFPILAWLAPDPYKLSVVKSFCGGKEQKSLPSEFSKAVAVPAV